ncbi:hypothetical protein [Pseudoalteromonas phenolica]|uniref:hypothetical protein n=1 Tax=Pseudoalteromonas phenolica TaxID=161398 RepID=UPI0014868DCC|nr:hypothetical protein [Pseudoalteromonas phenolica]
MFLNLNKKKLKELSSSELVKSFTDKINGGNGTPTDTPSRTSNARCVVEGAEKASG